MIRRIHANPPGTWPHNGFPMNHAVVEPAGRRVHLTGQVAWDGNGKVIAPGNAEAQTHACCDHIETILGAMGGTIGDVVSLYTFFVNDEDREGINRARKARFSAEFGPAATGLKVAGLWAGDLLVELTVIAVIPEDRFHAPA